MRYFPEYEETEPYEKGIAKQYSNTMKLYHLELKKKKKHASTFKLIALLSASAIALHEAWTFMHLVEVEMNNEGRNFSYPKIFAILFILFFAGAYDSAPPHNAFLSTFLPEKLIHFYNVFTFKKRSATLKHLEDKFIPRLFNYAMMDICRRTNSKNVMFESMSMRLTGLPMHARNSRLAICMHIKGPNHFNINCTIVGRQTSNAQKEYYKHVRLMRWAKFKTPRMTDMKFNIYSRKQDERISLLLTPEFIEVFNSLNNLYSGQGYIACISRNEIFIQFHNISPLYDFYDDKTRHHEAKRFITETMTAHKYGHEVYEVISGSTNKKTASSSKPQIATTVDDKIIKYLNAFFGIFNKKG